jgi:hypothetical protein
MWFKWEIQFYFLLIKQLLVKVKLEHKASMLQNKERHAPTRMESLLTNIAVTKPADYLRQ